MDNTNEGNFIIDYSSSEPKTKVIVQINGKGKRVLHPGEKESFQLEPGVYKAKFRFGFFKSWRDWIVIPPSKKPIIAYCSQGSEYKVNIIQSDFSRSVAGLLDNKKKSEYQKMVAIANNNVNYTFKKLAVWLGLCILASGYCIFESVRAVIKIVELLFGG